ncbi:MAG: sigma-54-dependent Fis family transcriptional regulator [Acidobacteria bacterium]|nr:sigma-54-dependent Fis family transcriptional regulator [Acidobacteriota bacterium]
MHVLIVEDNPQHAELARLELEAEGIQSTHTASAEHALDLLPRTEFDVILSDYHLPGLTGVELLQQVRRDWPHLPFVLVTGMGNEQLAVAAMRAGAADYLIKEARLGYLQMLPTVTRGAYEKNRLQIEVVRLRRQAADRSRFSNIAGASPAMRQVFDLLDAVAPTAATVMILGETGTGKELAARAIHYNGPRASKPFVAFNCGAIPENLVESELFGHEKGAFTGATARRIGHFESAHGGTLFLDEVADLPPQAQVSLLRALEERQIRRVGGTALVPVDLRVVAAANTDLRDLVDQGLFREDLYFRLNVVTIDLPPLRARGGDLLLLARQFLDQFAAEYRKPVEGFSPEALRLMEHYAWPGNVRELQHAVQRAVILANGSLVEPAVLPPSVRGEAHVGPSRARSTLNLHENERLLIEEALKNCSNNISRAALLLGVTRSTLYSKMERHGLKTAAAV